MIRKTVTAALFLGLAACGGEGVAPEATGSGNPGAEPSAAAAMNAGAAIAAAVASPERPAEARERDPARKPAEVLALSGIEPGDRIVEIAGFGQYYTTLLSSIVGPEGEVHVFDLPYTEERAGEASRAFAAAHANTEYNVVDYNEASFPADTDIVFNVLYYHDLGLNDIDIAAMNAKLFAALKPGGAYLVIDHKAEDGSGWRDAESVHRVDKQTIIDEVTAAGFVLETDSDLLANPDDDRSVMVFSPGTRGATDRAVLLFRKGG